MLLSTAEAPTTAEGWFGVMAALDPNSPNSWKNIALDRSGGEKVLAQSSIIFQLCMCVRLYVCWPVCKCGSEVCEFVEAE